MHEYIGHRNLEIVSSRRRFNSWMYEQISSTLNGNILEVGSGLGIFSEMVINDMMMMEDSKKITSLMITDSSHSYVNSLRSKFEGFKNRVFFHKLDLECKGDYDAVGYNRFDTIIALNVIEHVRDDGFVFRQFHRLLRKGGMLVVLVPSYKFLYNAIDESIGHHRRYTKKELHAMVQNSAFLVERIHYFNMAGVLGWYINGNLFRKAALDTHAFAIFDRLVPVWKAIDTISLRRIGLSMICSMKKN